jgi:hypothetical protein
MKQNFKDKIYKLFRIGALPAVLFTVLNMFGITSFPARNHSVSAGMNDTIVDSSIAPPISDVIKATPASERIITVTPSKDIDISYLSIGTSVAVFATRDVLITGTLSKSVLTVSMDEKA